jgi:hypothetical protein
MPVLLFVKLLFLVKRQSKGEKHATVGVTDTPSAHRSSGSRTRRITKKMTMLKLMQHKMQENGQENKGGYSTMMTNENKM